MVRDFDLFRLLGALVFVDALLLVIWMTLHPPSRNVIIQAEETRSVRLGSVTSVISDLKFTYHKC